MRGSRLFRKLVTRQGVHWFKWQVLGPSDCLVARGNARTVADARKQARDAERTAAPSYRGVKNYQTR